VERSSSPVSSLSRLRLVRVLRECPSSTSCKVRTLAHFDIAVKIGTSSLSSVSSWAWRSAQRTLPSQSSLLVSYNMTSSRGNLTNHRAFYVQKSLLLGSEVVWSWDGSCVWVASSENTIYKLIRVSSYSQGSALVSSCE
jgi:hypothetical protein